MSITPAAAAAPGSTGSTVILQKQLATARKALASDQAANAGPAVLARDQAKVILDSAALTAARSSALPTSQPVAPAGTPGHIDLKL